MALRSLATQLFTSLALLAAPSISLASIVATYSKGVWDRNKETHVIVVASGFPFPSVGYTQAEVIKEMYPQNQILFVTTLPAPESSNRNTKQRALTREGFKLSEETPEIISTKVFLRILKQYAGNIRSLDMVGHNGVEKGPWLQDDPNRLDYRNEALMSSVKGLFNSRAFARLQGCNTGWNVAPALSKAWGIPVMGTFTSTSFYFLAKSGGYELLNRELPKDRVAAYDQWSFVSDNGVASTTECPAGVCLTLYPESAPYHFQVHRSSKAAWLPFRKPVCDVSISNERCEKALAEAVVTSVTSLPRKKALSDKNAFKALLEHSVCASHSSKSAQDKCIANLRQAHRSGNYDYLPYGHGEMLKCSALRACSFVQDSIDLRRNARNSSESSIKLYFEHALRGYELLGGSL